MKKQERERRKPSVSVDRLLPAAQAGIFIALCLLLLLAIHLIHEDLYPAISLIPVDQSPVFTGYNGYGTAESWHPENSVIAFLHQKETGRKNSEALQELASSISCEFDQNQNLENGQTVTYACTYDKKAARKAGFTIHNSSRTYRITSLEQIQTIDPFADLSVISNGDGTFSLHVDNTVAALPVKWNYEWSDDSHLRITLLYEEDEIRKKGFRFNRSSIVIEADRRLLLSQSSLQSLSEENRREINRDVWNQPVIHPDIATQLGPGESLLKEPHLIRWSMNPDGYLEAVLQISILTAAGQPACREITVTVPVEAVFSQSGSWNLITAGSCTFSSTDIPWTDMNNPK